MPTVPEPENGSRTRHGTGSPPCLQVGRQPTVRDSGGSSIVPLVTVWSWLPPGRAPLRAITIALRSTTRAHGAPHSGQQPHSLVPAWMHGFTSACGKVANWANGDGCVAMVQT